MRCQLPAPELQDSEPLFACLARRRSAREFTKALLPLSELSQILWSAQGITGPDSKRTVPSAAGLYPLHLRVLIHRVSDLEPGIYDYVADSHSLKLMGDPVSAEAMLELGIGDQPWLAAAAVVIAVTAELEETVHYFEAQAPQRQRGVRYVYLETGSLAQNVHLQSTALDVGCVLVGGFDDCRVRKVLALPPELEPTALLCIGRIAS